MQRDENDCILDDDDTVINLVSRADFMMQQQQVLSSSGLCYTHEKSEYRSALEDFCTPKDAKKTRGNINIYIWYMYKKDSKKKDYRNQERETRESLTKFDREW